MLTLQLLWRNTKKWSQSKNILLREIPLHIHFSLLKIQWRVTTLHSDVLREHHSGIVSASATEKASFSYALPMEWNLVSLLERNKTSLVFRRCNQPLAKRSYLFDYENEFRLRVVKNLMPKKWAYCRLLKRNTAGSDSEEPAFKSKTSRKGFETLTPTHTGWKPDITRIRMDIFNVQQEC